MTGAKHASGGGGYQAWFDDNPVERMRAITARLDGIEGKTKGKPCGRNLNCPICQNIKHRTKIDIPTHRLKIDLGELPNVLVVRCTRVHHNQSALTRAVTKATRLSLSPRPSPSESMERMLHRVGKMRWSPTYKNLWPKAKMVVDILVEAVLDGGLPNGEIAQSKKEWMTVLKTRSSSQTDKAIAEALASGLVGRRRTQSPTLEGGRPSFLYGLKSCQQKLAVRSPKPIPQAKLGIWLNLGLNPPKEG
jgi:hypothetical protein